VRVSTQFSRNRVGSIFKTMKHLGNISKVPFSVLIGDIEANFCPSDEIIISDILFRSAKCKQCGKCCEKIIGKGSGLFFTENDIKIIQEDEKKGMLLEELETISIKISTTSSSFAVSGYVYCNKSKDHCDFFENKLCSIHSMKPVNCALPMLEFDKLKNKTYIRKRPCGRAWRMGCDIDFDTAFDFLEFRDWDFYWMKRLLREAEDLQLASLTWLPEIVTFLDSQMVKLEKMDGSREVSEISILWKKRFQELTGNDELSNYRIF